MNCHSVSQNYDKCKLTSVQKQTYQMCKHYGKRPRCSCSSNFKAFVLEPYNGLTNESIFHLQRNNKWYVHVCIVSCTFVYIQYSCCISTVHFSTFCMQIQDCSLIFIHYSDHLSCISCSCNVAIVTIKLAMRMHVSMNRKPQRFVSRQWHAILNSNGKLYCRCSFNTLKQIIFAFTIEIIKINQD